MALVGVVEEATEEQGGGEDEYSGRVQAGQDVHCHGHGEALPYKLNRSISLD